MASHVCQAAPTPVPLPLSMPCIFSCRYKQMFCYIIILVFLGVIPIAAQICHLGRWCQSFALFGARGQMFSMSHAATPSATPPATVSCHCTLAAHKYLIMCGCQLDVQLSDFFAPTTVTLCHAHSFDFHYDVFFCSVSFLYNIFIYISRRSSCCSSHSTPEQSPLFASISVSVLHWVAVWRRLCLAFWQLDVHCCRAILALLLAGRLTFWQNAE